MAHTHMRQSICPTQSGVSTASAEEGARSHNNTAVEKWKETVRIRPGCHRVSMGGSSEGPRERRDESPQD